MTAQLRRPLLVRGCSRPTTLGIFRLYFVARTSLFPQGAFAFNVDDDGNGKDAVFFTRPEEHVSRTIPGTRSSPSASSSAGPSASDAASADPPDEMNNNSPSFTTLQTAEEFPYLSSAGVSARLREIVASSDGRLSLDRVSDGAVTVEVVHYKPRNPNGKKALFQFGLHARELISPETGLRFVESLIDGKAGAVAPPSSWEMKIIVNANPLGRDETLSKEGCNRLNENKVDLNRNFPVGFGRSNDDNNPTGPAAFSEPETRILKRIFEEFDYDVWIDTHTGEYSMLFPWAHSHELLPVYNEKLLPLAVKVNENRETLKLNYGTVPLMTQTEVGGSCLDFATKVMVDRKKTPYAIAFETYGRVPWEDISIYYATYTNSAYRQQHQTGYKFYDSVGENAWTKPERDHKQECMHNMFSPAYVSDAQRVFQTWVPLYHDVLSYIAAQEGWMGERLQSEQDEAALRKQLNAAYVTQSHSAPHTAPTPATTQGQQEATSPSTTPDSDEVEVRDVLTPGQEHRDALGTSGQHLREGVVVSSRTDTEDLDKGDMTRRRLDFERVEQRTPPATARGVFLVYSTVLSVVFLALIVGHHAGFLTPFTQKVMRGIRLESRHRMGVLNSSGEFGSFEEPFRGTSLHDVSGGGPESGDDDFDQSNFMGDERAGLMRQQKLRL